jgi:hypothetical protein
VVVEVVLTLFSDSQAPLSALPQPPPPPPPVIHPCVHLCHPPPLTSYRTLNNNSLSGVLPNQLGDLLSLWVLYLNDNALVGPVPASFSAVVQASDAYGDFEFQGNKLQLPPPPGVVAACAVYNTCTF